MEYKYKILNPGGNKTALVLGNEYSIKEKRLINDEILYKNKDVEQVGFLSLNEKRLEMAGGEFCLNATRCAIYEYLQGKEGKISIISAGMNLIGGINSNKEVYVKIPINKRKDEIILKNKKYNIINLDGITLIIIDKISSTKYISILKNNEKDAKRKLKEIMQQLNITEKAVGIILLEQELELIKIHPIIWVKEIDTIYYETACGSGSLATAIYLNSIKNLKKFKIQQPSKFYLNVELKIKSKNIEYAIVSGVVVK